MRGINISTLADIFESCSYPVWVAWGALCSLMGRDILRVQIRVAAKVSPGSLGLTDFRRTPGMLGKVEVLNFLEMPVGILQVETVLIVSVTMFAISWGFEAQFHCLLLVICRYFVACKQWLLFVWLSTYFVFSLVASSALRIDYKNKSLRGCCRNFNLKF